MDGLKQDLKFALRWLARSPGFTIAAVLTLGLGIGASIAIFSVAYGVLLRPLPYAEPGNVVTLWTSWDNFPDRTWLSVPEYQLFHQENRTLEDLALYSTSSASFTSVDSPERVGAASVTPNAFDVLGVAPVVGRVFSWQEARERSSGVLLSYEAWMRRYGGDASVVGQSVELDGELTSVVGVLPQGFALPAEAGTTSAAEVYYPLYVDIESPAPDLGTGGSHGFYGVGRLRGGATVADFQADLDRIMAAIPHVGLYSAERRFRPRAFAAADDVVGSARSTILVLIGAVSLLLLIACGNAASLLLSKSEARTGELSVRRALGAGSGRIVRQLLTESLVLAGAASLLGLGLAFVAVHTLLAVDPNAVPRAASVRLDGTVVVFTLTVTLATATLFGLVPTLGSAFAGRQERLRSRVRGASQDRRSRRIQSVLVASQMAMSVILLTAAGLTMRSFVTLLAVDTGMAPGEVLTTRITAAAARYPDGDAITRFYDEVLGRIGRIPGVRSAAAVRLLPLASTMGDAFFRPIGYQPGPNESTQGDWQWVTPGYFETMGIPLLQGRTFTVEDRRDTQSVVLVNRTLARRYWGDASPVGGLVMASGGDTAVVVGVVGDVRHEGVMEDAKTRYYRPLAQVGVAGSEVFVSTMRSMTLTVGTIGDPRDFVEPVRAELAAIDPSVAMSQVRTMDEILSASLSQPRFALALLGVFAAVALTLAMLGIYGVLAYSVSQRTREIGLRMALGADAGTVVAMVVRQGFVTAVTGVAVGTALAWAASGAMTGLLYHVSAQDPVTFLAAPTLFTGVALAACWIPALRAAHVRPASALRYD
jgi:putative ABC transport system permease protein